MSDVANIKVNNTTYQLKDEAMREGTTYTTLYSNTTSDISLTAIAPTLYNIFNSLSASQLARVGVIYYNNTYSATYNNKIYLRCCRDGRSSSTPHITFSAPFAVVDESDKVGTFIYQVTSTTGSSNNYMIRTNYDYVDNTATYTDLSSTQRPIEVIMI